MTIEMGSSFYHLSSHTAIRLWKPGEAGWAWLAGQVII